MPTNAKTQGEGNSPNRKARRTDAAEQRKDAKAEKAKGTPKKAAKPSIFDNVELSTAPTSSETVDWVAGEKNAGDVSTGEIKLFMQQIGSAGLKIVESDKLSVRSTATLADGLVETYQLGIDLFAKPAMLVALCEKEQVKLTEATRKSAFLPVIKLVARDLDVKTASLFARVLNHGLACGFDGDKLHDAVVQEGIVAIARREAQRQRLLKGEAPKAEEDLAEAFRKSRRPFVIEGLPLFEAQGFVLALVDRVGPTTVIYDIDTDEKRVAASLRAVSKREQLLKRPEEGGDEADETATVAA